ncbi:MAG: ABC transporter substrate-binding protein, partial [Clostridium sp.]
MKKNLLKTILVACVTATIFVGCGNKEEAQNVSENTVIVKDVRGDVSIPAEPKKIVDLSGNSDILSILGYKVIGTANSDAYDYTKFPTYLEDTLKGAEILGYSMQDTINVEAVMNLNPDLIIISTVQEKMYDQLSEIAPTVMIKLEALDWKDDVRAFANVFNKQDVANKWIEDYEAKAKKDGESIKAKYGEDKTYLSFLASGGQFFIFDGAAFGSVLY